MSTRRDLQSSADFMFRQIFRSEKKRDLERLILAERLLIKTLKKEVQGWSPEVLPTIQRREKKTSLKYGRRNRYLFDK
jgi:hypothetical protein